MKRIALLATGGTIACRQTPDGLSPALRASQMLHSVPCRADVEIIPRDVFSMDSSNIQPEEWSVLARAVDAAMAECDGVVITHGTDTMGYTAAALSYMLHGQTKPVILTGSQLPLGAPLSDAETNLSCAIEAACPCGAVSRRDDGRISINQDACSQCGRCVGKCRYMAPRTRCCRSFPRRCWFRGR